jgi:hypothetical protein
MNLNQFNWNCHERNYVQRTISINGIKTTLKMHHEIIRRMGLLHVDRVDHKDNNPLNNQRYNLRIATAALNSSNRKINCNNTSGYKGVTYERKRFKYKSAIRVNGSKIHLGYFNTAIEAGKKYNEAAIRYFGDFANLNLIPEGE